MSEKNLQKPTEGGAVEGGSLPTPVNEEAYELTASESGRELIFKETATGRIIKLHAQVEQPKERTPSPLTPEQFRDGLTRLDALGLEWSADREQSLRAKDEVSENAFFSEEYRNIQVEYPRLPSELSAVVFHTLTGRPAPPSLVGDDATLEKKVEIVREFVIDSDFSSEFFFKRATKVPYFSRIDWEVVIKMYEHNVEGPIHVPYALLSLQFENPESEDDETITVAANLELLDELISSLINVREALDDAQDLSRGVFDEVGQKEGDEDEPTERKDSQ